MRKPSKATSRRSTERVNPDEKEFVDMMNGLAAMVGPPFVLTEEMYALYDRLLSPLGYRNLVGALQAIIMERGSRDPFPSIKEIRERIVPEVDEESRAVSGASKILQAVGQYGYSNLERARASLGDDLWGIVRVFGGWELLCQTVNERNQTTIRAQLRDLTRAERRSRPHESLPDLRERMQGESSTGGFTRIGLVNMPLEPAGKGEKNENDQSKKHEGQEEDR
jgi:hypothetical protein